MIKNLDIEKLNDYVLKGKLRKQVHPTLPLIIWNYTRETQYLNDWDEITIKCRGLVTDNNGVIINNPLPKFFNYSENKGKYDCKFNEPFEVYTKYDGSLIIVFWYNNELIVASKGSFISDHSNAAEKLLDSIDKNIFKKGITYCFEWIAPENRIVNSYENSELILLAIRDLDNNEYELSLPGFKSAEKHLLDIKKWKDLKKISEMNIPNEEGFVIKFSNGNRVKVKFDEYVRLHKILTNISTKAIFDYVRRGEDIRNFVEDIPDELDSKINNLIKDYNYQFYQLHERVGKVFDYKMYGKYNDIEPITDKGEFAKWVFTQEKWMQPILFKMFDKKEYRNIIWNLIEPKSEKI